MPDLSRLNQSERAVLALLAQGHTAKSIAALTGRSEAAINERLREARRKTGIGSSRELARLLARETRDEESGVANAEPPLSTGSEADHLQRRIVKGLAMISTVIVAATIAVGVHQQSAAPAPPLFADPATTAHQRLMEEARDPVWAAATEVVLRREYTTIDGLDRSSLSIRCAATLCEVNARLLPGDTAAQNGTASQLQGPALAAALGNAGLVGALQSFRSDRKTKEQTFAGYWSKREGGKASTSAS